MDRTDRRTLIIKPSFQIPIGNLVLFRQGILE